MATKIKGEKYWGEELHVPLSADGQVSAYVWPLRILSIRERGCGGPTIGIEVGNEEVLRFDCHENMGHWHRGGYDRLGSPGKSHQDFPDGLLTVSDQVAWSFQQIREKVSELLTEAEHGEAAQTMESYLLETGLINLRNHLDKSGYLRERAIDQSLIAK